MSFDSNQAYKHIAKLASLYRKVETPGEIEARNYIKEQFNSLGYEVEEQAFRYSGLSTFFVSRISTILISILLILSVQILKISPWLSSLIALSAIVIGSWVSHWGRVKEKLSDIYASHSSSNIIARKKPDKSAPHLVFLAHYDSKSQTVSIKTRSILFTAFTISGLITALLIFYLGVFGVKSIILNFTKFLVWIPAALSIILLLNRSGNKSFGAVDNATGVGVILELARVLKTEESLPIGLTFIATGAEEMGLIGATKFIQRYGDKFSKDNTWFVNFDSVGIDGPLLFAGKYGVPRTSTSKKLIKLAFDVAKNKGLEAGHRALPMGVGTDQIPIGWRGFEAITISSKNKMVGQVLHSTNDTIDKISKDAIQKAGEFGVAIYSRFCDSQRP
jgi:acetylornithine deacetylase/succinyl-diaminopimelate desuccinylase-like protein